MTLLNQKLSRRKTVVLGSSGLVGSRFVELYKNKHYLFTPSHEELDITSFSQLEKFLSEKKPEVIVNFSAYTDVDKAEDERDDKNAVCWKVNFEGVENILDSVENTHVHFVQVSTDYVFSGSSDDPGPYPESHFPEENAGRVTWYGHTKAESERLIRKRLGDRATILRVIYPVRSHFDQKLDYVRKPLKLFDEGNLYPLFTDQQISLTFIDEACLTLEKIITNKVYGTFHASSKDLTTPYEAISFFLKKIKGPDVSLQTSSVDSMGNPVRYPKYGGLRVEKTEQELGMRFSSWREIVDQLVAQGIT